MIFSDPYDVEGLQLSHFISGIENIGKTDELHAHIQAQTLFLFNLL